MTRYVGPVTEQLMRRCRVEGGVAINPDVATQMLSYAQQIANAGLRKVLDRVALTTKEKQLLYNIRGEVSTDALDIVSVQQHGRSLLKADVWEFFSRSTPWWRETHASRHEHWCQIGRDLLVIHPAISSGDSEVIVTYAKLTSAYDDFNTYYNTALDLPDEDVDHALGIAEALIYLRSRALPVLEERAGEAVEDWQRDDDESGDNRAG